jgi:hypothetical protein
LQRTWTYNLVVAIPPSAPEKGECRHLHAWPEPTTCRYPAPMTPAMRQAPPELREALRAALVDARCPVTCAAPVAAWATFEQDDDGDYICVLGNCVGVGGDHDVSALDALAENVVADNAVADRTGRAERGYEPLWPLPGRAPRR